MAVLSAVVHFRPYLAGRSFALVTDCSALTWLFRSRDLDPKLYRWSLRLAEFDMTMRWRAGSSHQLPDALSRLPRPGPVADPIDDSFPDDATSGERRLRRTTGAGSRGGPTEGPRTVEGRDG